MIIYSVTVSLDESIEAEWLDWMKTKHIPDVMNTGYFLEHHFQVLLEPVPEEGFSTFNIQYECESMEQLEAYQEKAAGKLQEEHNQRYKDRFTAFRTILMRL